MLQKDQRLTRKDIDKIKKEGQTIASPSFRIRYLKAGTFAVAPVVSKKVSDNAVERNGLRREIYRVLGEQNKEALKLHMVIFLQKKMKKDEIEKELKVLIKKISK